jgi:dihydropyrimidinase/allantoinase
MSDLFDLTIHGGLVVTTRQVFPATLAVRGGRVAAILAPDERPAAAETIDAAGLHILPGVIDTHVHLRDPGGPQREDFTSGTRAAAAGGITTIMEMPISEPPVHTGDILTRRAETVQPRALVDFALYGAVGAENISQVGGMVEAGAVAFKTFLTQPIPSRAHEFIGLCCTDEAILYEALRATAKTGLRHCFHCEHYPIVDHLTALLRDAGRGDGLAHAESRPEVVEDVSVAIVLALAAEIGGAVQVVHMSSPRAAQMVKRAKSDGVNVTAETCPQYLFLTWEALKAHGPFAKCNPALRSPETVQAFWPYLFDDTIDVIGSDHAPYVAEEKTRGLEDVFKATAGMPGLEPMLPLMLTAVNQGRISLPRVAYLMAERAADLFRLPGKGRIAVGHDADLTLVDLAAEWTFDRRRSFSKAGDNMRVYHGRQMKGRVISTLVRGRRIYQEGDIVAQPGYGRFVRPDS